MSIVSIIGKPNVGKSTLFNRLTSSKDAVVHETPNLTRDRHYGVFEWRGRDFQLIDTGGIEKNSSAPFVKLVEEQVDIAIKGRTANLMHFDHEINTNGSKCSSYNILVGINDADARGKKRARAQ